MVKTAYRGAAANKYDDVRFADSAGRRIHEMEFQQLRRAITYLPPESRVLEIGCGTGRFLVELSLMQFDVVGLDPSLDMLRITKQKLKASDRLAKLQLGEASSLPYKSNCFDFVYTIRVINQTESVVYAMKALSEIVRIVNFNGYVLVEFVNYYRPHFMREKNRSTLLRPRDVLLALKEQGLSLIWMSGVFFFGMTAFRKCPIFLIPVLTNIDRLLASFLPWICSRCYIFAKKDRQG